MRDNFEKSLKAVLVHEGGWSNHKLDPGGQTMRGVTQAVYDAYRRRLGLGVRSVKFLADDELRDIYRKQYWDTIKGDELPHGVDYAVFDFAVNSGPSRAARYLQTVLGVASDGVIGQITLRAAEEMDERITINGLCDRRMAFLRGLPTWETFGKGWASRVSGVRSMALGMVAGPNVVHQPLDVEPPVKDHLPDAPKVDVTDAGHSIAAIVLGALGALIAAVAAWIGFGK